MRFLSLALLGLLGCAAFHAPSEEGDNGASGLLASAASDQVPWLHLQANSDQRQPVYLGATPRELALGLPGGPAVLPDALRRWGEERLAALRSALVSAGLLDARETFDVEAWPARDDSGRLTWVFARWRQGRGRGWRWIEERLAAPAAAQAEVFLPHSLQVWQGRDFSTVFDDFLLLKDLYAKPIFGDCVWTDEAGQVIRGAWLLPEKIGVHRAEAARQNGRGQHSVCQLLPQPARLRDRPLSMVIRLEPQRIIWPPGILWQAETRSKVAPHDVPRTIISHWPPGLAGALQDDVGLLAGERDAVYPMSGRRLRFTRKNSADEQNQLEALFDYLEERYARLGLRMRRQRFTWRGIPQSNLIAVVPGTDRELSDRPLLMADHVDTAFCEDVFARSGIRVSTPGADDNAVATAALLRAAEVLPGARLRRDVWLVHLTGEEFPGDDLGARELVSEMLRARHDIAGLVLMDMIGHRSKGDRLFQINAGDLPDSLNMAGVALAVAHDVAAPDFTAVIRTRFDPRSYLYNTDGLIFSDAGYPVILLNEHINPLENLDRPGYHQSSDSPDQIDWAYATAIAKVAIETVARLALAYDRGARGRN